jgi:uncharacterized repeat protein (TIGR01451 family)
LELAIGTLASQETRAVTLILTPRQPGNLRNRVTATAEGGLADVMEHSVLVSEAKMSLSVDGPQSRYQGRPAEFTVRLANPSSVPLNNVTLRNRLPAELAFVTASEGGQLVGGEVVWNLGTLAPQEQKVLHLTTRTQQVTPNAVQQFLATADPGINVQARKDLQILGIPAFKLEMGDDVDPVPVGGRVRYTVNITNTGSLPANEVALIATVPPEMRIVSQQGASQGSVQGQVITFAPLNNVPPNQMLAYTVEVQVMQAADVRFRIELRAQSLQAPVIEEESTKIYNPINGGAPASPPAGPPPGNVPPPPPGL